MSMRTRSRARKEDAQTRITDTFKTTRRAAGASICTSPAKKAAIIKTEMLQTSALTVPSHTSSSNELASESVPKVALPTHSTPAKELTSDSLSNVTLPSHTAAVEELTSHSLPEFAVPSHTTPVKELASDSVPNVTLASHTATVEELTNHSLPEFAVPSHITPAKELASDSVAEIKQTKRKLFDKKPTARRDVEVNDQTDLPNKHRNLAPSPLPVPEFVLPSHTTPAKELDSDSVTEVQQTKRKLFEKGHTARLYAEVKQNNEVDLPKKYQNLLEKFHCCDRIVSIFTGRGSRCEADEIFKNVQKTTKKEFNRKHLAQILALYPKSYNLRLEEQRNLSGQPVGRYDLVMEPNLIDDLIEFMHPESPQKRLGEAELPKVLPGRCISPMKSPRKKLAVAQPRAVEVDLRPKLEGWRMMNRKYVLHHLLAERVKRYHTRFMEKMGDVADKMRSFHPTFLAMMETECSDIEQAELPEPPRKESAFKDVRQFMDSVKGPETAVDVALKELSSKETMSASRNIPLSPKKFAQLASAKPGARSLLERIRAKEAQKKALNEQRDPEAERRYYNLEMIHSKLLRPLLSMFVQKNCRSMQLSLTLDKMEYSTKRSKAELKESLELLCAVAPEQARIVEVTGSKYLQVELNAHEDLRQAVKTALDLTPKPMTVPSALKSR